MRVSYELIHFARPYTHNQLTSWHYHQRARVVKEWRQAFKILALQKKIPRLTQVVVTAQPFLRGKRSLDVDAPAPTCKSVVDGGLVDSGVLEDDKPPFYVGLMLLPAQLGAEKDAFVVTITGDLV